VVAMGASEASAKRQLERRVAMATTESHRLRDELERAIRVAESLEARCVREICCWTCECFTFLGVTWLVGAMAVTVLMRLHVVLLSVCKILTALHTK
jgi:hypothetical protein